MLKQYLMNTKFNKYVSMIDSFFRSNYFICILCGLVLLSVFFGLEIPLYICITLFCIVITLVCDDMLGALPMVMIGYMTISRKNNPIDNPNNIYDKVWFWVCLIVIIIIILTCLILRLIYELKKNKKKKPRLLYGFIALSICMICGGLGTQFYSFKSVLYGLLVALSLGLFYFYFYYTIDWNRVKTEYFANVLLIIGLMMIFQVCSMYIYYMGPDNYINRFYLKTGWGITNNVGGVICMCIPAGFYLSIKKTNGWIYSLLANLIYIATLFTQSRNAILISTFMYLISAIISIIYSKNNWWKNTIADVSCIVLLISIILIFKEDFYRIFKSVIDKGLDNNGRFDFYISGINAFKYSPTFGTGFYDYEHCWNVYFDESSFLAPRYHSTIIQMMASTGIVGCLAYSFHRIQTLKLVFKKMSIHKFFIGLTIAIILVNSLLDCMFFNFGPGLHYSCLLVMLEGMVIKEQENDNNIIVTDKKID